MNLDAYTLAGGLAPEQIDLMRDKAIDLVETVGLHVPHEGLLNRLQGINGVMIESASRKSTTLTAHWAIRRTVDSGDGPPGSFVG